MSIVSLQKVTVIGHLDEKEKVLDDLQRLGCLHLDRLDNDDGSRRRTALPEVSQDSRDALRYLKDCPVKRRRFRKTRGFDPSDVQEKTLANQKRMRALLDERDFLVERIAGVRPWGDFEYPPLDQMNGLRLWFYLVPHHRLDKIRETGLNWEIIQKDNRYCYVVVVSKSEPDNMPVDRTLIGEKSLSALEERLDEVDHALDEGQAERESLTRWIDLFEQRLSNLEARANRKRAAGWTLDDKPLFALQGWTPVSAVPKVRGYARSGGMVFKAEDPLPDEIPPTLLENGSRLDVGEGLVTFYMTPGYRLWDPSKVVLFSFTLFFAMILSDAGYGVVLALGLLIFRKRLRSSQGGRKFRVLLRFLASATIIWGVLVGSYFGLPPRQGSFLAPLQILDMGDMSTMMTLSILIGAAHVILANGMDAWRRRPSLSLLAPAGWIIVVFGALFLFFARSEGSPSWLSPAGTAGLILGLSLILIFAGADAKSLGSKVATGFISLARVTNAFGDILSYLRLFALGLASASLAMAFNDLARDAHQSMGGFGILVAFIIIVVGHTLNFVLALVSGFVHGLRLNLIEFFNWGIPEEGIPFRAFAREDKPSP